jgi:hypothetical protein
MTITNGYTTLAKVKSYLRIPDSDTVDDAGIETAINTASREIDAFTERVFYNVGTATRTFVATDMFTVDIDDLQSLTSLKTAANGGTFDTTFSATDYQLEPLNGVVGGITGHPFTRIRAVGNFLFPIFDTSNINYNKASVQVTGTWGFAAIPDQIEYATALYALRIWKRQEAPFGIAGFGDSGVLRVSRLDPDVSQLIAPFKKVKFA